jgi:hypothetical protein
MWLKQSPFAGKVRFSVYLDMYAIAELVTNTASEMLTCVIVLKVRSNGVRQELVTADDFLAEHIVKFNVIMRDMATPAAA